MTRQPSLILSEITWRWCFGAAVWTLLLISFSEYLYSLPVANLDWLMWHSGIPPLMSEALGNTIKGSGYKLLRVSAILLPAFAILWTFASALARAATLRVLVPEGRFRLKTLLGLSFLRAATTLAALIGVIGIFALASRAYRPQLPSLLPHPGRATMVVILGVGLVWYVWSVANWLLGLAPITAAQGTRTIDAIAIAIRHFSAHMRRYAAIGAAFAGLHLVAFIGFSWLAMMLLGTAGILPGKAVLGGLVVLTLAYFALVDFLYVARLAAYASLQSPDPAITTQQPELQPEPSLAAAPVNASVFLP